MGDAHIAAGIGPANDAGILVVDDELEALEMVQRTLRGYPLYLCGTAERARGWARELALGVALADYRLADTDGIELLREIGIVSPRTVRVLVTGAGDGATVARAINEAHADFFLAKPYGPGELQQLVATALRMYAERCERDRLRASWRGQHRMLRIVAEAQEQFLAREGSRQAFEVLLAGALELTDSEFGFIGEVVRREQGEDVLRMFALSDIAWDEGSRRLYQEQMEHGFELANMNTLFGAAIRSREPVISNAPARDPRAGGLPPGHPPLRGFLGLPFVKDGAVVGMLGVANRVDGYDAELVRDLRPFVRTCATLLDRYQGELKRRAIERALDDQERRLRAVFESSLDGIVVADAQGRITMANPAVERLFGYPPGGLLGEGISVLMPGPVATRHDAYMRAYREGSGGAVMGRIRELEGLHRDGTLFPLEISVVPVRDADGVLTFVGTLRDITQRRRRQSELLGARRELEEANRELALMARTDELTGLANRREFDERLALELRRAARTSMPVAICMCDVDFFKRFNDAAGHLAGDECLRLVGRIVRGRFRRSAEVPARYGGEEFAVLVPGVSSAASAIAVGERLRRRILEERIEHPDSPLGAFVTTSAGVAWGYPSAGIEPESALAEADAALYAAKDAGRDRVELSIAWPSPGAPAEPEGPRRRHPAGSQTIARK